LAFHFTELAQPGLAIEGLRFQLIAGWLQLPSDTTAFSYYFLA